MTQYTLFDPGKYSGNLRSTGLNWVQIRALTAVAFFEHRICQSAEKVVAEAEQLTYCPCYVAFFGKAWFMTNCRRI